MDLVAVLEQFYKDTSLAVLAEPSILADAIVQGVRNGALGIASQTQDGIAPTSVRVKEDVRTTDVSFSGDTILLAADRALTLKEQTAEYRVGLDPIERNPEPLNPIHIVPAGSGTTQTDPIKDGTIESPEVDSRVKRLTFRASGIPSSKIADLNRGVFLPLSRELGEFTFTVEVDLKPAEGISKQMVEQQVKETLRQLGARVIEGEAGFYSGSHND